jgi:hypothetical protein
MRHTNRYKKFLKNKWVLLLISLLLCMATILVLLPVAGKHYLTKWLMDNGADTAVIERIKINPFTGRTALKGVNVKMGDTAVLSDADILIDISMLSLLKKQARIKQSVLSGVTLDIELYEDGRMRFGSYTTTPADSTTPEETTASSVPWIFIARQVDMSNCRIHFKMPQLDMTLDVNKASLIKFTTAPGDKSGTFTLSGLVNGTPVALDLTTLRIAPDIIAEGRIKVDGFSLDNLGDFLQPYLKPFTGKASLDGKVMFKLAAGEDIFVDYDGMLSVDEGHIAGPSFSVKGAPVRWEKGTIHFEMTEQTGISIDVDGRLTGKKVAVDIPDPVIKIREPNVAISGKVHVAIDDEVKVDTNAGFTLKHTTFSMPPLQAEATNIHWQGEKRRVQFNSGTKDRELSVQVRGELLAESPSFGDQDKDIRLAVTGSSLSWNGDISYLMGLTAKNASKVRTNGRLKGNKLNLTLADALRYSQKSLVAKGNTDVSLGSQIKINYDGNLDFKGTDLQMNALESSGDTIAWKGKGGFIFNADKSMKLHTDSKLVSKGLQAKLIEAGLLFTQQSVDITTKGAIKLGKDITVDGKSSLATHGFTLSEKDSKKPVVVLENFAIDSIEAPGGSTVKIREARATGLDVNIPGSMPLKVTAPTITISDIHTKDLATVSTGRITAQSPVITSLINKDNFAGLNSLEIRNVKAGLDRHITVDRINFDDLYFLGKSTKKDNNICRIAGARLSKIGWNPETGLRGTSLSFADLYCTLIREKGGGLIVGKKLAAMRNPDWKPKKIKKKPEKNDPSSTISLSQVTLRGDSGLHFEDHTLEVPFISNLDITTLQIKGLDSGKPDKPASIKIAASMEKRAPLTINGTIAPFLKEIGLNLKLQLKNYPLSRLSAYTVQSVGVALASGSLQLKSDISLGERQLNMQNKVLLKQLKTSTISKKLADKLDNQLPIPLDSALSLLRDRDDTISLDVPLSGPINKLSVGISDILITALAKAIVPAASGYLVYALGPYGALAWVGMEVGDRIMKVRLPPIEFNPADDRIPDDLSDYFERLAKILQDKPKADFRLCPKSSAWEFFSEKEKEKLNKKSIQPGDEERKKLMELGQRRAQKIKDELIEKYSIDKDRLLICVTEVEEKKSAKPRVDIQM